jgi:predicted XRE-type DNA-binding protein
MEQDQSIKIKASSGNIFADLGFSSANEELAKADLAFEIYHLIIKHGLTSEAITQMLSVDSIVAQSLINAEPVNCSLICLQNYLNRLREISPQANSQTILIAV